MSARRLGKSPKWQLPKGTGPDDRRLIAPPHLNSERARLDFVRQALLGGLVRASADVRRAARIHVAQWRMWL